VNLHNFRRALHDCPEVSDTARLRYLNVVFQKDPELIVERDRREDAFATLRAIRDKAEGGKVAVIESGMDCDGVQYAGVVHTINATPGAYTRLWNRISESADGRFYLSIARPSVAKGIQYRSRDRVMEAYEDGHPHSIAYGSMDD
jgi:hypothetical protein